MMRTHRRLATAVTGAAVALVLGAGAATAADPTTNASTNGDPTAILLTGSGTSIVSYRISTGKLATTKPITGLSGDTALVGIDFRVQDNRLYGVGNAGGLYFLRVSGVAKKVKQLGVALDGTSFGVDFNPVANALRIVSNTGQNLRQPFADLSAATVVDGPLNYTAGVTASGVVAAAYTNNDYSDTTGTTLFDVDAALDQVAVQAPANTGALQVTGKTGVDIATDAGLDIFTPTNDQGRASANTAYLVNPGPSSTTLATVALLTGDVTSVATIPVVVTDLAVQLVLPPAA